MTTENTDAGIRILTKAIRKLTAQLAEADETIRHEEGKRKGAEDELTAVRAELAGSRKPDTVDIRRGAYFLEWHATPIETVGQLAAKRMAELAESQKARQWVEGRLKSALCGADELRARIDKALEALPSSPFDPYVAEAARILTGEESA